MDLLHLWCIIGVILQRTVNGQQLVSQGKPIIASSQHKTWSADKAVDGDKMRLPDTCECCAATAKEVEPWYKLDLEQTHMVQRINVIGREITHNLRGMEIKLGTSIEGGTVLTKTTDNVFTYDYTLPSPQLGRYVTLTLRGITQYFIICELEVYAECSGNTYGEPCVPCGKCLNDDPCDKTDGSCQSCAAGYQGSKCDQHCNTYMYGLGCTSRCGQCENDATCNNVDGTCVRCKTGYMTPMCKDCSNSFYGNTCNERCYCAVGSCDTSTGVCPAGGCTAGYKGNKCDTLCDSNMWGKDCLEACGNCLNGVQCDVFNGRCPRGCSAGYKGQFCTKPCEDGKYGPDCNSNCGNCLNNATCDKQDGRCTSCAAGYKGDKCIEPCNRFTYGVDCKETCGNCSNNVPCDHANGSCPAGCSAGVKGELCKTPCEDGSYGRDCKMSCGNCRGGETCNAETGFCGNGCTEGFNGTYCNMSCPNGTFGRNCVSRCGNCFQGAFCKITNGQCKEGCEPGYKEPTCTNECENGTFGRGCQPCGSCINGEPCDKLNGTCQECALGYSLHNCTLYEECGVNTYGNSCFPCGHCLNDTPCDKQDGTCGSCAAGYTGNKCVEVCLDGSYGIDCQLTCGKCHRQSVCLKDTGNCPQGCEPGFLGPLCHRECEDGTYGEGCTSICGNCHGDEICNKQNGTCQACECGYAGHDCKGEINSAASRGEAMIVGGTLVSILAIEGVAAALFLLIRKRRRSLKKDTINRSNPYEVPDRGINEGEHEYESAMELDVNTNAYENTDHQAT